MDELVCFGEMYALGCIVMGFLAYTLVAKYSYWKKENEDD